jgi:exonuclease V gamma subunit
VARGELPLGDAGRRELQALRWLADAVEGELDEVAGWAPASEGHVDVDLRLASVRLSGRLAGVSPGGLVRVHHGKERPVELLTAWIELLARRVAEPDAWPRAVIAFAQVGRDGAPEVGLIGLDASDVDAVAVLGLLVDAARSGLRSPLPFFPKSSHEAAKALKKVLPEAWRDAARLMEGDLTEVAESLEEGRRAADSQWLGSRFSGEGQDRYHRHAFGEHRPYLAADGTLERGFLVVATGCWWPIFDARHTTSKVRSWRPE